MCVCDLLVCLLVVFFSFVCGIRNYEQVMQTINGFDSYD